MTELTLIEGLTKRQREVLADALDTGGIVKIKGGQLRTGLHQRNLIDDDGNVTDLGRYQVRWYSDDAARAWQVEPDSFGHYVRNDRAPAPDGFEHPGGTMARAWWYPETVTSYDRGPGRGNFERIELDMSTVIRQYRAGIPIRKIAASLGVSPTTVTNRLEEAGEKAVTSSSRTAYRRDQRASISAEGAG